MQADYSDKLNSDNIPCFAEIDEIPTGLDTVFLFHSFEHLPDPLSYLEKIKMKLKANGKGKIVIEVPHAKDFLIDKLKVQSFIDFTLWSQHLVLHTRESLNIILSAAGFHSIHTEGVQRYPLSNHLNWLVNGQPGGHKKSLSIVDTLRMKECYEEALNRIDATDTLVAVATT
jgi:hypothetical protein